LGWEMGVVYVPGRTWDAHYDKAPVWAASSWYQRLYSTRLCGLPIDHEPSL